MRVMLNGEFVVVEVTRLEAFSRDLLNVEILFVMRMGVVNVVVLFIIVGFCVWEFVKLCGDWVRDSATRSMVYGGVFWVRVFFGSVI